MLVCGWRVRYKRNMERYGQKRALWVAALLVMITSGALVAWRWTPPSSAGETGPRAMVVLTRPSGQPLQPPAEAAQPLSREGSGVDGSR